jgi:O-glycosyl hydrolase
MYYIMGHFSKFVLPESVRVEVWTDKRDEQLETIGFETKDQNVVVVLLNTSPDRNLNLTISVAHKPSKQLKVELEAKSIKTLIWKK